jgi:hypothetical protein
MLASRFGPLAPPATPATYILDRGGWIAWAWLGRTRYGLLELAVVGVARP